MMRHHAQRLKLLTGCWKEVNVTEDDEADGNAEEQHEHAEGHGEGHEECRLPHNWVCGLLDEIEQMEPVKMQIDAAKAATATQDAAAISELASLTAVAGAKDLDFAVWVPGLQDITFSKSWLCLSRFVSDRNARWSAEAAQLR
ncbi:unnamed protein product [Symbiodinium sp. CCMP2592]|nr:unnamed protein product [Symbiodinium sp. CCMP2592]